MIKEIDKDILRLAVPAIFSNITVPLLGLSDTFITGHLGSERYIAAIAVGTMMANALFWLFGFLRAGTTGLTAEAWGRGDSEAGRRIFTASFLLAAAIGLALVVVSYPLGRLMIAIMAPPEATAQLAVRYFMLIVLAAPAQLATMAVSGWMIGRQNTVCPMVVAISVNVINIALSFVLVFAAGAGFTGVAVGTLVANWSGLLIALVLAHRLAAGAGLWCGRRELAAGLDVRRFFRVNSDLMMRSVCILAVPYAMTAFGARLGDVTLAVNAVIMQFFLFFSYFMDGFAFSGEALCGRYAGAADRPRLRATISRLSRWCAVMALLFCGIYSVGAVPAAALLTDNSTVVAGVGSLRWVVGTVPLLSVAAFMFDGVYIGLTATRSMLVSTFAATAAYFSTVAAGNMMHFPANNVLWTAFLLFLALRGLILLAILPRTLSRINGSCSRSR